MANNRKARRAANTLLSRDAILALKGGRYEDVPALGGTVRVLLTLDAGGKEVTDAATQMMRRLLRTSGAGAGGSSF